MKTNLQIIQATYEGTTEENGKHLLAALAPERMVTVNLIRPFI